MARTSRIWTAVLDEPVSEEPGVVRLVPLAPAVLGATLAFLALGRLSADASVSGASLAVATGTAGTALALCSLLWRRHELGTAALHAVLAGCVLLGAADTVAYTQASGRPDRAAELILLAAGCGVLLVPRAWYLGGLGAVLAAWATLAADGGSTRGLHLAGLVVSLGLAQAVRRTRLSTLREQSALRATGHLTTLDPLTGLPDRRGILLVGSHLHAIARRESSAIGCAVVEIGGYRAVLATSGQAAADALVLHVAGVLRGAVRETDVVGRWAPDRLAVVAHGQGAGRELLTRRLAQTLEEGCPLDRTQWPRLLRLGHAMREPWEEEGLAATLVAAAARMGGPLPLDPGAYPQRDEPQQREQHPDEVHRANPVAGADHRHLEQAAEHVAGR
jgi:diguanylate cyclase (GGDEF)-like protein